jgi:hypothetical protein
MTTKRFVDHGFWFRVLTKLECIRSYRFPVMNKKPRCYPNIYRCIQCLPWHCQSVLIFWHFDCSLDFFNFSLRGTKIHPKKPARLHFLDQLKASFSSNICSDCICHLEFQNFTGEDPPPLPTKRVDTHHSDSRLQRSGSCLWHVQSPPTCKNLLKVPLNTIKQTSQIKERYIYIYARSP